MLLLYAAMQHDYGRPEQGLGFEHCNFFDALRRLGFDILYFDFVAIKNQVGKAQMNRRLLEVVKAEKPDLMFTVLFTDELDPKTIRAISDQGDTTTINWFCDDHWRFDGYSRHWAPCFNWVVTTAASTLPKYQEMGYSNVIKSQWGCNHFLYRKLNLPPKYDVTFVGQPHGNRQALVRYLETQGIAVQTWGAGWPNGRISQNQMIEAFNQSHINLNLSNASASTDTTGMSSPFTSRLRQVASRALNHLPLVPVLKQKCQNYRHSRATSGSNAMPNPDSLVSTTHDQIKGRNFEVPGCGGFMMTGAADNLDEYYRPGSEIAVFQSAPELVDKIRHYLHNEDERAAIARAGYERTLKEHTYVHRFADIFAHIGKSFPSIEKAIDGHLTPGKVVHIA